MPKFRTHYDNLKVSRDAPMEVIQAAYRSLARKYHPDQNRGTRDGEAIMKVINASYEVLSDPVKRAKHDRWIAEQSGRQRPVSASWDTDGRNDWDTADEPSARERRRGGRPWSAVDVVLAISYVIAAFSVMRIPNLRLLGIGMLLAGWVYIKALRR
jgi:curved DNA-binding protein CbpA